MYQIDVMSRIPVYEQIIDQTEKFILLGILKSGDKIPSVRSLSMELSVNPNTIQKAVAELDRRGLIFAVPGKGCFISEHASKALAISKRSGLVELKKQLEDLAMAGILKSEILALVDKVFAENEGRSHS